MVNIEPKETKMPDEIILRKVEKKHHIVLQMVSTNWEEITAEVTERDCDHLSIKGEQPFLIEEAYGIVFVDILTATFIVNGKEVKTKSTHFNKSPTYFLNAKLLDLAQVQEQLPEKKQEIAWLQERPEMKVVLCPDGVLRGGGKNPKILCHEI